MVKVMRFTDADEDTLTLDYYGTDNYHFVAVIQGTAIGLTRKQARDMAKKILKWSEKK